jgi:hypothetical protein
MLNKTIIHIRKGVIKVKTTILNKTWLRQLGEEARKSLVPLTERRNRNPGELTAGQGKMCSYSGNA